MTQQHLLFPPAPETREQRCRRILAGVPQVQRASALYFDLGGEQHARGVAERENPACQPDTLANRGWVEI